MKATRVKDVMRPFTNQVPSQPHVLLDDRLSQAIKKMIQADVRCIAVWRNQRPIGMVRLDDALHHVGLDLS